MKKFVIMLCAIIMITLCSCSVDTSGYTYELTSNIWEAEFDGGGKAVLKFDDDTASLTMSNGDLQRSIEGRYIADDSSLVIFMPELKYNYCFKYTPRGNTLELEYNDMILELNSVTEN